MASPAQKYRLEGELTPEQVSQLDEMLEDLYTYLTQSPLGTSDSAFDISELVETGLLYADADGALDSFSTVGSVYVDTAGLPQALSAATGNALISGGAGVVPSFGKIGLTTHVSGILPIANGGTNKTGWTAGSVVVATATDVLGEDNAGLFFDVSTNRLGIGIASPTNALDVRAASPILAGYYSDTAGFSALRFFEGTTLKSSVQQIGSTFATAGRRLDLEIATLDALADVVIRPNDVETARFTVGGGLTLSAALTVANGGSGRASHTAYAVLCGGTTATGAQQSIAGVGTSGQVLTSNGASALPTFQDAAGGIAIGDTITSATEGSILFAGASGVLAQDNANLFWNNTSKRLGLGVDAPGSLLHLRSTSAFPTLNIESTTASGGILQLTSSSGNWQLYASAGNLRWESSAAPAGVKFNITQNGIVQIGTTAAMGAGTSALVFGDGTALTAASMPANTAGLYADDVAGTVEMFAIDEAGNSTQISPHGFPLLDGPSEEMAWSFYSKNKQGKEINVDMLRVIRAVERLAQEEFVVIKES